VIYKSYLLGVAILSKVKPLSIQKGMGKKKHDGEGRCLTAEVRIFYKHFHQKFGQNAKLVKFSQNSRFFKISDFFSSF